MELKLVNHPRRIHKYWRLTLHAVYRITPQNIIGENQDKKAFDIVYENGLPKLSDIQSDDEISQWNNEPLKIIMETNCKIGEDCLKLLFRISKESDLYVNCFDINEKDLGEFNLGNIFKRFTCQEYTFLSINLF